MLSSLILRITLISAIFGGSVLGVSVPSYVQKRGTSQYEENDKLGAVASESSVCSRIGVDLIKAGGNAADALVGTVFCVGVIGKMTPKPYRCQAKQGCRNVPVRLFAVILPPLVPLWESRDVSQALAS